MLEVVGAIIRNERRVLLAQRKQDALQGLLWEFPGGKIEEGEDHRTALAREILEELGVSIEVGEFFAENTFAYGERRIRLACYLCRLLKGRPEPLDCKAFRWVEIEAILDFDLSPADIPIARALSNFPR